MTGDLSPSASKQAIVLICSKIIRGLGHEKKILYVIAGIAVLYLLYHIGIPVGDCGEETVSRTRLGVYSCAGWDGEAHDWGCTPIAGIKGYFSPIELTYEVCLGELLKDDWVVGPQSY